MKITIIAAVGQNRGIGTRGMLPWHLPSDLKRFRDLTMDKDCACGYRTYLKLPYLGGRRIHLVPREALISPARFLDWAKELHLKELVVIGGAKVYKTAMPIATHMELTMVNQSVPAGTYDTFFPEYNAEDWRLNNQGFCEDDDRLSFWSMERKQPCYFGD